MRVSDRIKMFRMDDVTGLNAARSGGMCLVGNYEWDESEL